MTGRCGAQHPEDSSRTCILYGTAHGDHMDLTGPWKDEQVLAESRERVANSRRGRRGQQTKTRHALAGMVERVRGAQSPSTEASLEAIAKWSKDEWVRDAEGVFMDFLRQRKEPFTTAEHVWPLLDCPAEMRAMVVVVRRLLKIKAMEETGAIRLKGIYRTRDGMEFAENKLVPVYRSLLVDSAPAAPTQNLWGPRDSSKS